MFRSKKSTGSPVNNFDPVHREITSTGIGLHGFAFRNGYLLLTSMLLANEGVNSNGEHIPRGVVLCAVWFALSVRLGKRFRALVPADPRGVR